MGGVLDLEELANIQRIESFDLTPDGTPVYPAHRDGSYDLFRGSERITDTTRDLRHPIYLDERSPKKRADEITAPLLVIHGANDPRVPQEEAEQIVEAVDERDVPTEYLLFEDEGHMVEKSENRIDTHEETRSFFDQHLGQ